jgi:hypothetical protein
MDLLVRTPKDLKWRLEEGESFHTEIITKGKILYEKIDAGVGAAAAVVKRYFAERSCWK